MKIFVAGASGATGQWLVTQLLEREQQVVTVVRSTASLPEILRGHKNLSVTQASLLDLSDADLSQLVKGCAAVALCLGHNMTFKGIFGNRDQKGRCPSYHPSSVYLYGCRLKTPLCQYPFSVSFLVGTQFFLGSIKIPLIS